MRNFYDFVMDPDKNPLSVLPKMVRFQYMVILGYMWSATFAIAVGSYMAFGYSVVIHVALALGFLFTGDLFARASRRAAALARITTTPKRR